MLLYFWGAVCTTISTQLLRSPLLKCLQIAFLLNFHLLENSSVRSRDEGEWFALGMPLSTHVIPVENGLDLKDHKGVWCSSYILQQKNRENSHCSCAFAFSITYMKQAMPCQFGTSSVLPWCTHAVSLLLVCVGRGWAGRRENDTHRGVIGLGLRGEGKQKRNGEHQMNCCTEIRHK